MSITPTHFDNCDWGRVIERSEPQLRGAYSHQFSQREQEANETGSREAEELYSAFRALMFPHFDLDSEGSPFPGIDELDPGDLRAFAEVFDRFDDPELRARIGDVLWLRGIGENPHEFAFEAIDAYLDTALQAEGVRNNKPTIKRFSRALSLAQRLNQEERIANLESALEERISDRAPTEETWWSRKYSELLFENDLGDSEEQGELMEQAAQSIENPEDDEEGIDFWTSREYWKLASRWHSRAGVDDAKFRTRREAAERFVRLADMHEDSALMEAGYLEDAFAAYQNIRDAEDRKEELHRRMLNAQKQAVKELGRISTDIGEEKFKERARKIVAGLDLREALLEFAFLRPITSREELERMTRGSANVAPAQAMWAAKQTNAFGRVTGRKPSSEEDEEAAFEYEVYQSARFDWAFQVVNGIQPARWRINEDHDLTVDRISALLSDNPLVPKTRTESFAKGLHAGFEGDFLLANHILAVQFESSVRHLLQREGAITSGFAQEDKTQYERNLNNFLEAGHDRYSSYITNLFGEDIAFQLRALLVDERGANLRNEVAHALLPDAAYYRRAAIYFWWLVWHLIVYGSPHLAEWIGDPMDEE
ncbi:DUF4209 domain-containing protein [Salinibacter ruber]|uniref:DUF4209 domain-containing protein n=1 Tax=Salinibacter ruber TaxID=146919 RepID=A0A9X2Q760_9BACT|nr:DUF4209 domain-containing protein [Salinibacter ruber]MCS3659902.1 hypothetical protein [Salinibacter ruber]MCS3709943.1 hypothetical protein [Salinibacter ruber]MCS4170231.1 hypothetical protein [Salinibacter ruber]